MFAAESALLHEKSCGIELATAAMDIVEIAALRGPGRDLKTRAEERRLPLPALGQAAASSDRITMCVRPDRWLLLTAPASAGTAAAEWETACAGFAVAIDLSSSLTAFHLGGPATREVLARGCRLDVDPGVFPVGNAAATIMAQVSVILVRLASGMLLLTPSTTARHMREWLVGTARPFGLGTRADIPFADLCGERLP